MAYALELSKPLWVDFPYWKSYKQASFVHFEAVQINFWISGIKSEQIYYNIRMKRLRLAPVPEVLKACKWLRTFRQHLPRLIENVPVEGLTVHLESRIIRIPEVS